jgi:LPLT family lysophospholipid transporter-like MFS transporter
MPKGRLMAWMNGAQGAGRGQRCWPGCTRWPAFAVVGLGAAAYAPAKYGLVTEMVPARQLVAANGWIEVSVVCAVLLGTVLRRPAGQPLVAGGRRRWLGRPLGQPGSALQVSLLPCWRSTRWPRCSTCGVPDSGARYPAPQRHPAAPAARVRGATTAAVARPEGGLSLAVTTIFWGVGATLQFIVLRWAARRWACRCRRPPAAGRGGRGRGGRGGGARALGAAGAARRMLAFGVLLGLAMPAAGHRSTRPGLAVPLLVLAGAGRRPAGGAAECAAAAPRLPAAERRPLDRRAGLQRKRQRAGHAGRLCGLVALEVPLRAADDRLRPGDRARPSRG